MTNFLERALDCAIVAAAWAVAGVLFTFVAVLIKEVLK